MVVRTGRRRMATRRKKTRAQILLEQKRETMDVQETATRRLLKRMKETGATQKQIQQTLALSTFGGGILSPIDEAMLDLPPLKIPKIAKLSKSRPPKKRKTRVQAQLAKLPTIGGIKGLKQSSVAQYLEYYPNKNIVQIRLGSFRQRNYYYIGVPRFVFNNWWEKGAICQTTDTSSLKRWKKGKTGSLGAFYNQNIKGQYKKIEGVYNGG